MSPIVMVNAVRRQGMYVVSEVVRTVVTEACDLLVMYRLPVAWCGAPIVPVLVDRSH